MTLIRTKWLGRGLGLLLAAVALAPAQTLAQATPPGFVSFPVDPGVALSQHLVSIAENPRNLSALKGAGEAALALGDPQAALGFLARAEEISPSDGSIKAAIGSALLQLEQARSALRFFDNAVALGIPDATIAGDRGLAYDLTGNPRLAQRDYQLALNRQDDPEVRRRLALSFAISGERDAALHAIDAQLRQQDRAAWRVRAFVLALTGDTEGATSAVRAVMAPPVAAAMEPFLARLPSLAPADRAFAVHFGRFPQSSAPGGSASVQAPQQPGALAGVVRAGEPDPRQEPLGTVPAGSAGSQSAAQMPQPPPRVTQLADGSMRAAVSSEALPRPEAPPPAPPAVSAPGPQAAAAPSSSFSPSPIVPLPRPSGPIQAASIPPSSSDPNLTGNVAPPQSVEPGAAEASVPPSSEPGNSGFADVVMLVSGLADPPPGSVPVAQPSAVSKPVPVRQAAAPNSGSPKPQAKKAPAPSREPSRIWVQVAGGAAKEALPREFARLRARAPALFNGKTAWTTALRATNRLLVGPFRSEREAQEFVNQLARADLAGFTWTSEEGQAIERLTVR